LKEVEALPIRRSPNGVRHTRPQPGRDRPEWVVAIKWNEWSQSIVIGGRNQPVRPACCRVILSEACAGVIRSKSPADAPATTVRITIRREPSNRPLTMELSLQLLPVSVPLTVAVIASEAKQFIYPQGKHGSLRRFCSSH
jgi:hypothetical protein